jgi:SRSO17 transposase
MAADQEQLERFVRESPWETQQVQTQLREQAPAAVQGRTAALIVDGVGFPKKGAHSVGVGRQWCGVSGKVDNCQMAVNLTLAVPGERSNADQVTWPMGMQLYLPKKWGAEDDSVYESAEERERYARLREETGIPEAIGYRSKHTIATDLIETAYTAVDHACVVADAEFGKRGPFRQRLRELGEPYVAEMDTSKLAVVPEETDLIEPGPTPGRGPARKYPAVPEEVDRETVDDIATRVEETESWEPIEWAEGSKGTLSGLFYRERVRVVTNRQTGWIEDATGWLLLEKEQPADGEEHLKAWLCWGVDDATLDQLVSWAHVRWTVEQFHKEIKQVLGADDFQGRTWDGFHHHLAVVMLAHAFVAEQRLKTGDDGHGFDSFEEVVRRLVREAAIHRLMANHGFDRQTAEEVAVDMLRGFSEWS